MKIDPSPLEPDRCHGSEHENSMNTNLLKNPENSANFNVFLYYIIKKIQQMHPW